MTYSCLVPFTMVSLACEGAFPPGSSVKFNTVLGGNVQGDVVCFDPTLKVLIIKDNSTEGKPTLRMFNMSMINNIVTVSNTKSESVENYLSSCSLTTQQATDRCALSESIRRVEIMDERVSLEGQKAFLQLRKLLNEVRWQGPDIIVLGRVTVKAPYTPESVQVTEDTDQARGAMVQVKKILSKPYAVENKLTAHKK